MPRQRWKGADIAFKSSPELLPRLPVDGILSVGTEPGGIA